MVQEVRFFESIVSPTIAMIESHHCPIPNLILVSAAGADIDFVENEGLEGSDEEGGLAQNAYDMPPSESESESEDDLKDL
jgi:hypothetical protein